MVVLIMDKKRRFGQEWYLYSAGCITGSISVVVIVIFQLESGKLAGMTMTALLTSLMLQSEDWRALPKSMHKQLVLISTIALLVLIPVFKYIQIYRTEHATESR